MVSSCNHLFQANRIFEELKTPRTQPVNIEKFFGLYPASELIGFPPVSFSKNCNPLLRGNYGCNRIS